MLNCLQVVLSKVWIEGAVSALTSKLFVSCLLKTKLFIKTLISPSKWLYELRGTICPKVSRQYFWLTEFMGTQPSPLSSLLWWPLTVAATQQFLSVGRANQGYFWMSSFHFAWTLFLLLKIFFLSFCHFFFPHLQARIWQGYCVPAHANGFLFWVLQFDIT